MHAAISYANFPVHIAGCYLSQEVGHGLAMINNALWLVTLKLLVIGGETLLPSLQLVIEVERERHHSNLK